MRQDMADGDYERRAGREAELKRLARILAEARAARAAPRPSKEYGEALVQKSATLTLKPVRLG